MCASNLINMAKDVGMVCVSFLSCWIAFGGFIPTAFVLFDLLPPLHVCIYFRI